MLERLDEIDWSTLVHAYGEASDVPGLIRALVSPDAEERDSAYGELFANIWHQGTVYEASVHALPFLIDLLEAGGTPERESLALLVASIMSGRGYFEVHFAKDRINPFTGKPVDPSVDIDARLLEEKKVVAGVRERGARAVPLLLPFLKDEVGDVRSGVAQALAEYPSQAASTAPAIRAALAVEPDEEVRLVMRAALQDLAKSSPSQVTAPASR